VPGIPKEKTVTANPATALATIDPRDDERAFEPVNMPTAEQLATKLFASGLLNRGINRPEAALALIITGREFGLTAMQSLRGMHIIEGKPTLSADMIVALVRKSGACESFRMIESTAKIATFETRRVGDEGPTRMSFTIEEAQAAKLTGKDNWMKFPAAMLRARCSAALARVVYQDVVAGVYDPDEIEEPKPRRVRDVTPPTDAPAAGPVVEDAAEVDPEPARVRAALEAATTPEELAAAWKSTTKEVRKHDDLIALKDARKAALSAPTPAPVAAPVVAEKPAAPPPAATPAPAAEGEDF